MKKDKELSLVELDKNPEYNYSYPFVHQLIKKGVIKSHKNKKGRLCVWEKDLLEHDKKRKSRKDQVLEKDWYTARQAAKMLELSYTTVCLYVRQGKIKATTDTNIWNTKSYRFHIDDINACKRSMPRRDGTQELSEEEKEKLKEKEDLRKQMLEFMKNADPDERFILALREKRDPNTILDYPERTICGCDGEIYNTLMNWAYREKIPNHLAFDAFFELFEDKIGKVKQRPASADRSAMRYIRTKEKQKKAE